MSVNLHVAEYNVHLEYSTRGSEFHDSVTGFNADPAATTTNIQTISLSWKLNEKRKRDGKPSPIEYRLGAEASATLDNQSSDYCVQRVLKWSGAN